MGKLLSMMQQQQKKELKLKKLEIKIHCLKIDRL